jgi:DNA primase catalytic subunit
MGKLKIVKTLHKGHRREIQSYVSGRELPGVITVNSLSKDN